MKNILLSLALLCALSLNAQVETKQDSTIYRLPTVTIIGEKVKTLPGSGQVIGKKELSQLNQPDVNKVLATVPGINIREEEGFGLRPNIGLRGTPVNRSARITLMEDGILMAPAPYSDPSAYYFPTFPRMEGVEILKGSSQIKYGPYTIGGAVNLLSTSIPDTFKGFAQLSYGSFGTNQQRIWVGDSRKNFDYVFEVNRWASNGFKKLDNGGNTGFDRRDVMGKLRWHTDTNAKLPQAVTLKFVNVTENSNEAYLGLTYEDFKTSYKRRYAATQKDNMDLTHTHISLNHFMAPSKNISINTTAYYARTYRDWARVNRIGGKSLGNIISDPAANATAYRIMTGQQDGDVEYQGAPRTFTVKGIQTNFSYRFQTGQVKQKLEAGIRYHEDKSDRFATGSTYAMTNGTMVLTDAGIKGNAQNQVRSASSVAAYLQYELNYKGLTLTPGIRYEYIKLDLSNYGNADNARTGADLKTAKNDLSVVIPGVGINYAVNQQMSFFGGVHKGFSPPGTPTTSSAEQAKVETAVNYELGYRFDKSNINAQVVFFLNDYNNILGSDNVSAGGLGTGDMFNAGKASIQGIEISARYDLLAGTRNASGLKLPLDIAYTYTSAKFRETFKNGGGDWGSGTINKNDVIPFIAPHLLTTSIGLENEKFNATLISRFVGKTRTKPGQDNTITPGKDVAYNDVNAIGNYWVFDVSGNYRFHKNFSVFTTINNIFNNQYIVANLPVGYRPGLPFSFSIGLKVNI